MVSLHVDVVVGIALGVLLGAAPAVGALVTGAIVEWTDVGPVPRIAVVATGVVVAAAAAVASGLVRITGAHLLRLGAALVVVGLLTAYGYSRGVALAASVPRDRRREVERAQPLSDASLDAVDASGQVTIGATGEVRSLDGYPSLSEALKADVAEARFRLPADLPLDELESRVERQLTERFDLAAVSVSVDSRGRATVAAAPPVSGIAGRVPDGYRAVTVSSLVPSGLVPGEDVQIEVGSRSVEGTVLDASDPGSAVDPIAADGGSGTASDADPGREEPGGQCEPLGRVTVAVPTASADALLDSTVATVAIRSRDTRADFRALSALEAVDRSVRFAVLDEDLVDSVRSDAGEPQLLAARADRDDEWQFDPSASDVEPGWEAFLVGDRSALADRLAASGGATSEVIRA